MPDGEITYAGEPMLLNVAEFQEWMDTWLPLSDLYCLAEPAWRYNGRLDSRSGNTNPVGFPRGNHPPFPPIKLNTLYWPTGASRWAFMFLISPVLFINPADFENFPAHDLVVSDGTTQLSTAMYLLPPRGINIVPGATSIVQDPFSPNRGGAPPNMAWLLPLVDERYFWQWKNVGDIEIHTSTTWSSLYAAIADILTGTGSGILHSTIDPKYLKPDPQELTRRYENAAAMLDAIAHSVGQRIVRRLDGTIRAETPNASAAIRNSNTSRGVSSLIAGGEYDSIYPESFRTVFPKMREFRPYADKPYSVETPARSTVTVRGLGIGFSSIEGFVKTIHSTCFAITSPTSTEVINSQELEDLAFVIGADWSAWMKNYDLTYTGLIDWIPTGYDDHIEWTIGNLCPGPHGEYLIRTRVQSRAYNFGVEEQLSQQDTQFVLPDFVFGKLDEDLLPKAQTTVSVWWHDGSDWVDLGVDIEAFAWTMADDADTISSSGDLECLCEWDSNSNLWLITQVACPPA